VVKTPADLPSQFNVALFTQPHTWQQQRSSPYCSCYYIKGANCTAVAACKLTFVTARLLES
jgi:hypothetical protein